MNPHQKQSRADRPDQLSQEAYERVKEEDVKLAKAHVKWFLTMIEPLLESHFLHGLKHGRDGKE